MSQATQALFEVDNLRAHYRTRFGETIHAVDGVSFALREGEVFGIAGESGCGKSTLVNATMGLFLPPLYHTSGAVRLEGKDLIGLDREEHRREIMGKRIAMIPQGALNSLNPTRRVRDLAADAVLGHFPDMTRKEVEERLRERFDRIGLGHRVLTAYPVQLSGGMKQRVVIAISTLMDPKVVIADEPTSALDVSTQRSVIEMIFDLMDKGIIASMIFITHELPLLSHIADRIAVMYAGQFVEVGATRQVIDDPRHPYSLALMRSMLHAEPGGHKEKPMAIPGAPPDLQRPPAGCRFAERCPTPRKGVCETTQQELAPVEDRLVRCQYAR
jgi:peptide/nickel transport system ATP-binding protein